MCHLHLAPTPASPPPVHLLQLKLDTTSSVASIVLRGTEYDILRVPTFLRGQLTRAPATFSSPFLLHQHQGSFFLLDQVFYPSLGPLPSCILCLGVAALLATSCPAHLHRVTVQVGLHLASWCDY